MGKSQMRVIIAGSREGFIYSEVERIILSCPLCTCITEVVSGHARGVDTFGEQFAKEREIPITIFRAEWNRFGKSAGYVRNKLMAQYSDGLIAIWDGHSKGTKNMIDLAREYELITYLYKKGYS